MSCLAVYLGVYWIGLRCLRAVILGNLTDVLTYLRIVYTSASIRVSTISTTFISLVSRTLTSMASEAVKGRGC